MCLRCSSEVDTPVDLHLIVLADKGGARVVDADLKEKVAVDLHLVVLADRDGAQT